MSIVNSQAHSPTANSAEVHNLQIHNPQIHNPQIQTPHSQSLEALVRIALINRELAPGVAKQINAYRNEPLDGPKRRLLAILEDAIADNCIVIIQPVDQPIIQPSPQPATLHTQPLLLCNSVPSL